MCKALIHYNDTMSDDLVWASIRSVDGSKSEAFEQLCAILAHREDADRPVPSWQFIKNGRPDGGVECYWRSATGDVYGFQAKYFCSALGDSQWAQCKKSFEKALSKYPTLVSIVFCFPQDLANSPASGRTTARQKWERHCQKWKKTASEQGRKIEIVLWDSHELTTRLLESRNQGLLRFFFEKNVFTSDEASAHVQQQIAFSGPRYQPELHVANPLEDLFDWLAFDSKKQALLSDQIASLGQTIRRLAGLNCLSNDRIVQDCIRGASASCDRLQVTVQSRSAPCFAVASAGLRDQVRKLNKALRPYDPRWRDAQTTEKNEASDELERRWDEVEPVARAVDELSTELVPPADIDIESAMRSGFAVISGVGGCGKTHLLCKMAEQALDASRPVILLLGQQLNAARFWSSALGVVDHFHSSKEMLEALNIAGQVANSTSLILIDAIEMSDQNHRWPAVLRSLATKMKSYPNVAVVVTVRNIYKQYVLPDANDAELPRYYHMGFGDDLDQAVDRYFDHYNIAKPDVPYFHPEFENPLFLSLFCRSLAGDPDPEHSRPPTPFRGGTQSFEELFDLFLEQSQKRLVEQFGLDLDSSEQPLKDAIWELARLMAVSPTLSMTAAECGTLLKQHLQSSSLKDNLVQLLESEGILSRFPRRNSNGRAVDMIGFAYDRMTSHFVVRSWLDNYDSASAALALLADDSVMFRVFGQDDGRIRTHSIVETLVLQWRDKFGEEMFDTEPKLAESRAWQQVYVGSQQFAADGSFGPGAAKWLADFISQTEFSAEQIESLFRRISCSRINETLHEFLFQCSLPERDAWWTVWLGSQTWREPGGALISWAIENEVPALGTDQAVAYATSLAWLTTTTRRRDRARAIKAIASVLEHNLLAVPSILERFLKVNDPYVLQGVSLGIYGACMRCRDLESLRAVGESIMRFLPRKAEWPVDILVRHALSSTIELAARHVEGFDVNLDDFSSPFESEWKDQFPAWPELESEGKKRGKDSFNELCTIITSCSPEGVYGQSRRMYGDFGRYVVGTACGSFRPPNRRWGATLEAPPFRGDLPHRFIVSRVLELGWTEERFGTFDRMQAGYSRSAVSNERVGKKYQWIALAEFLARAADRYPIFDRYVDDAKPQRYSHPGQFAGVFRIDPSIIRIKEHVQAEKSSTQWWAKGSDCHLWDGTSNSEWLRHGNGFLDPQQCLLQTPPGVSRPMAMLAGFLDQHLVDPNALKGERSTARKSWLNVHCYAVHTKDVVELLKWAADSEDQEIGLPDNFEMSSACFGEMYWSRVARYDLKWSGLSEQYWAKSSSDRRGPPCDMLPLTLRFYTESDPSVGSSLYASVPSPWLVDQLGLRAGPQDLVFTDSSGEVVCASYSRLSDDTDIALCDLEILSRVVADSGLALVWCVLGEKNIIGDSGQNDLPLWPRLKGTYVLAGGKPTGEFHIAFDKERRAALRREERARKNLR